MVRYFRYNCEVGKLAFALVALVTVAARADPPPLDADPDLEIARRHFVDGTRAYGSGDYAKALEEFRAAQAVRPAPEFDYNIARCLDRMERPEEAIESYRRYAANRPGPDGDEARERIRVLGQRLELRRERPGAATSLALAPAAAPAPRPLWRRPVLWVVVAAAALVVAGVTVGVVLGTATPADPSPSLGALKIN